MYRVRKRRKRIRKLKKKINKIKDSAKALKDRTTQKKEQEPEKVPRITNKTVAEHREEVIKGARKFILPLQESKHKVVLFSVSVFIAMVLAFFGYCTLALYRFQSSNTFIYRVTQVIPFPVARTGSQFIAYENYLFELRRYKHFYENQQELDFDTEAGQRRLAEYRHRALDDVVNNAYIKQLAQQEGISVSDQEVEAEIAIVRNQNRLGNSEEVLEETLRQFWGWSLDDFKRSLRQQLLTEKVVQTLDTETRQRAEAALAELKNGANFADVAQKYSDDAATSGNGGEFGGFISRSARDLDPEIASHLFKLEEGEYSEIFATSYGLEIVKLLEKKDNEVKGAHILLKFKDAETFINDLKDQQPARLYVSLPESNIPDEEQQGGEL